MIHYTRYSSDDMKETLRRLAKSVSKAHKGASKLQVRLLLIIVVI